MNLKERITVFFLVSANLLGIYMTHRTDATGFYFLTLIVAEILGVERLRRLKRRGLGKGISKVILGSCFIGIYMIDSLKIQSIIFCIIIFYACYIDYILNDTLK